MTQIQIRWEISLDNSIAINGYSLEADLNMRGDFKEIWNGRGRPEITTYTLATVNTG